MRLNKVNVRGYKASTIFRLIAKLEYLVEVLSKKKLKRRILIVRLRKGHREEVRNLQYYPNISVIYILF